MLRSHLIIEKSFQVLNESAFVHHDDSVQQSGYSQQQTHHFPPASPSESLQTVVTYAASFTTPQERMEFALQVQSVLRLVPVCY